MNLRNQGQANGLRLAVALLFSLLPGWRAGAAEPGGGGQNAAAPPAPGGLRIDEDSKTLTFTARATGIAQGEAAEFVLVRRGSAKDYEAMALSAVRPSQLDRGLRRLGMKPGRAGGMNEAGIPLWPKGERVLVSFIKGTADPLPTEGWTPVEHLVLDGKRKQPLAAKGFVFIGSRQLPPPEKPTLKSTATVYAADVYGPQSVIALYNEPRSVLEFPEQALQGDAYGRFTPNPETALAPGERLTIRMRPEYPGERRRVLDLDLRVEASAEPARGLRQQVYRLSLKGEEQALTKPRLTAVLNYFAAARKQGRDPFVTLSFDDALPLASVGEFCRLVDGLDAPRGIRLEPPPPGQIYYRAFAPKAEWRERAQRVTQPYELDLERRNGQVQGILRYLKPLWEEGQAKHKLEIQEFQVSSAAELGAAVRRQKPGMEALFVEAPAGMTYGTLREFTRQARVSYPTMFVFTRP